MLLGTRGLVLPRAAGGPADSPPQAGPSSPALAAAVFQLAFLWAAIALTLAEADDLDSDREQNLELALDELSGSLLVQAQTAQSVLAERSIEVPHIISRQVLNHLGQTGSFARASVGPAGAIALYGLVTVERSSALEVLVTADGACDVRRLADTGQADEALTDAMARLG